MRRPTFCTINLVTASLTLMLLCLATASVAQAQPGRHKDELSWDRRIRGLVGRYCLRCHNADDANADVDLERDRDIRLILQHRETWEAAFKVLDRGEMPPEDERQPSEDERNDLKKFIRRTLDNIDCSSPADPGYPSIRRLNRAEYDLSIADLTGLELNLSAGFPPDASAYGFDHLGQVLTLSPAQMQRYYAAAQKIVAELISRKSTQPDLYTRAFGKQPATSEDERPTARAAFQQFATRAFRRPADAIYVDKLMQIYDKAREKKQSHEQATAHALTAVLISPKFLLRLEQNQPGNDDPYAVDDYELATRLSYFLWSRPPDEQLLKLAAAGKLSDPKTLESETRRMLRDPRSTALSDHFFGQWLSLRDAAKHQPDKQEFPGFTEELRTAMTREMQLFLADLVQQDRPVTHLIDARYTFLNQTLADHYGIKGDFNDAFKRTELNDRRRGGVVTSAALTMLLADPGRTNVPRRGNFIAGRLLGSPPPPPPADVPPLEDTAEDSGQKTLREMLELHRSKPQCASCHAKMDPLGFALENYDAIGRWRDKDNGLPIDASGQMRGSKPFNGPAGLKDLLLSKKPEFLKTLTRNLLIYALARGLRGSDECVVRDVMQSAQENELRFSSVVVAIVKGVPFRYRRNPID